ncbi:MAG: hypothetical protein ACLSVD_03665 [Eggerthellaceae bacterium]
MYEQLMAAVRVGATSEEHLLMQDARDSAVALTGRGAGPAADNTTPEDHLSFEFQFMAKRSSAGRGARCWRRGALRRAVREATRVLRRAPGQLGAAPVR